LKAVCKFSPELRGTVKISGSKNASLPILIATLLTDEKCFIENVPRLDDVFAIIELLKKLGKKVLFQKNKVSIKGKIKNTQLDEKLVRKLRASVLVMGPVLARKGYGSFAMPGGCALGERPIDIHLSGFEKMGARYRISKGRVIFTKTKLKPVRIKLKFPSVGATENLIMTASLIPGITVIENSAIEPEVIDLANFLKKMGVKININGKTFTVKGSKKLKGAKYRVIPDRIEAGTFLLATASVSGQVQLKNVLYRHLESVILKLKNSGVKIKTSKDKIHIKRTGKVKPVDIETAPYPGFPTDLQPMWAVYMLQAKGVSKIKENVFPSRFMYVDELKRLGADLSLKGNTLFVKKSTLSGTHLLACDLRAAASMIIAGLISKGTTEVSNLHHLSRGYENFFEKLQKLGANVSIKK